ncbi:TonB family protein [Stenotrophomonas sp. MYb238]|uniref:energy transducer TonB n=1 Tax=Stenotrophomonas sp. MYb238 TaxID=2040281 RepID=UPI0012914AF5|nr:energy transducer TonB [Stenotrophomonas sp. MYb238]MQP76104.1 TonB family protein [Stenotrophomonas sp. MYb238]
MVRTQPGISPIRFDTSRILAYSTAIALHALAAGLLLIPLSQVPIRSDAVVPEPRWQLPDIVPVVPTPPPPTPVPVVKHAPPPTPHALPAPVENAPMPVFATEAVIPQPAESGTPTDTGPVADSIAAPAPLVGVQLRYLHAPAPAYPRDALRVGAQGTVTLRVLVGVDGKPLEVSVERSSGNRSLDNAARSQVLRQWTFQPATDNGRAVQAYGLVPVDFKLN